MARRTYPRPYRDHVAAADNVLTRYQTATGTPVGLPVPIELIVEKTYGLTILTDDIEEEPGTTILGALFPQARQIVLNARHEDLFAEVIGPEQFTLAHELGHWIYDAEYPEQLTLDLQTDTAPQFCYHRAGPALAEQARIREVNANKFAACLVLPEQLVRSANLDDVVADLRGTAAAWGVSQKTLKIRLEELGLLDNLDRHQLDLL